jgi:Dolichyl-phosphate-mannose-protein mannosyltransferase
MASTTITRPAPGPDPETGRRSRWVSWPLLLLGALILGTLIGFVVYPTYPNYDSYYSLLWGREVLHGVKPSFDAYRAPTEHPLAVAFGALLAIVGDPADRIMVGATLASFVVLAAGLYRLARASFGTLVGLAAAGLLCTRFDFPFLAARAYIDIPYLAFVVWAAALESERPRRGTVVFVLLACAGLMRPEAWLLSGLYFLWCLIGSHPPWPQRVRYAVLTAFPPVLWTALDWWATGDPKFSLTHTSGLAEELGRTAGLSHIPSATVQFLKNLDKVPVFYAGIAGLIVAVVLTPRRARMPLALLVIGLGTFVLVGLAGLSVIDRYLLVPSLVVMVFAAVALGGWTMLQAGRVQKLWAVASALLVVYGVVFTVTRVNFSTFTNELIFRGDSHASLKALLNNPKVRAGMRCGPVSTPNHKLIPDSRWILNAPVTKVIARSDATQRARIHRGVAIYATNRLSLLRSGFTAGVETPKDTANNIPMAGFTWVAATAYYGAYVRC